MAALKYREEHNKVGYMEKPKGSDDYHQVLDFLRGSHFRYALTHDPIIFDSLVKQFWSTASLRAPELGSPAILATIDRTLYTITEYTVRSQLQLGDDGGIKDLPIADIYLGMDNLGYPTEGKLTFHKNKFSPQWRFLVHTIQHCLSSKSGSWDQFGSPLAIALICLSDGRRFNWSRYIFKGMVHNINDGTGEVAPNAPQTIPETIQETRPEPDHSQEHLPTPPRTTTTNQIPPVFEQGHTSDPNIASFSRVHVSDPDLFTSTNVEDETLGGSFHTTPPRSTQVPPEGPTSGGAEDLATLTALSSLVSELVQKVSTLESELQAHKLLFKEVVGTLVKKVKALELKLNTRSRKVVMSESDTEDEEEQDVDPLIKLAKAAAASDAHVDVSPGADVSHSPPHPTSDVPTTEVPTDVPSVGAPTGPSPVSPGSTTVPTSSSVPAADTIPANSGTTPETPSSPLRDVRKGKGVAVEAHSPTPDKTFKQLEEERLGWEAAQRLQAQELADFEKQRAESLMKDANFARQMSQDFEMTEDQRKRQQEVLASAANYSDAAWDIILARLQANPDLSSTIFGVEFTDDDFAARMVELVNTRRKELAEQRAKERRERPMTPSQLRQYMRTYVKNQGPAVYSTGWTMAQVRKLSPEQLQEEFDKIQRAVAFTRGLKRDGSPMTSDSSKKLKTGDDEVTAEAPSHGGPQEDESATPSRNVSREEVAAPPHSQDIPVAQVKVLMDSPEVNDGSDVWKNQHTWSIQSWKLYSFSGVHVLETVSGLVLHMFVDKKYPLSVNLIERMLDHQLEICHGSVGNELTTAVQLIAFLKKQISDSKRPKVHDCPRVNGYLVKASSNSLLFFDSPLPGVNTPWDVMRIVSSSASIGIVFLLLLIVALAAAHCQVSILKLTSADLSRNLKYVVPTGKDNVIVSAGRTKVIPAGGTILVLCSLGDLKNDEYETWAMKMEYWIMNSDHNLWNIFLNGNSRKKIRRDPKGNIMILPHVSVEEHIAIQRETKARTILLQFGGNDESKKMQKSMLKQEFSEFRVSELEGFGETFGSDEVFDPSAPSIFDTTPEDVEGKPLYDRQCFKNHESLAGQSTAPFVKAVGMHVVPSPITRTFMPPSNKPDLDDTQVTYGSKSNNYFETNSVSNDFVSCDNSDKSSNSETIGFASYVSSVKSSSSKTNEHLASASSSVDFKTVSKTADQKPSSTIDDPSFSFKENVKTPRNICNKSGINNRSHCKNNSFGSKTCFVCGSKFHLIKDCDFYEQQLGLYNKPMWHNVANIPSFVPRAAYVPAGSRNPPASVSAGSAFPAGSRNRPASVSAGRPFSAGWRNHAARPMTRPTSHYFQHFRRPGCYNQLYMDEGRWGTAVKTSAEFMKVAAFGVHAVNFLMLLQRLSPTIIRFLIQEIVTTSRYVVPAGRVKVLAGRYVVPTGKDNVIVSADRSKVIPAGRTILVL
ncbi:hypothetical protein Tco_1524617, partial [Tanacetum coccineum]